MNIVYPRNPPQLVRSFQLFIDAFSFSHLGDHPFHSILADLICFRQMIIQLAGEEKPFVQSGAMLLQVSFPHPAIVADSLPGRIREVEIRKVAVAMQGIMDASFGQFFRETGHFHFRRLKSGLGKLADIPQNRRLIVPKP